MPFATDLRHNPSDHNFTTSVHTYNEEEEQKHQETHGKHVGIASVQITRQGRYSTRSVRQLHKASSIWYTKVGYQEEDKMALEREANIFGSIASRLEPLELREDLWQ